MKHLSQLHHCRWRVAAPNVDGSEWIPHIHEVLVISTHEK